MGAEVVIGMTPRERVYKALRFEETDFVPYQILFTTAARQRFAEYAGDADFESKIGNHLSVVSHRHHGRWQELEPGHSLDEWGVIWNRTIDKDIGNVEHFPLQEASLKGFRFPDPKPEPLVEFYPGFMAKSGDRFTVANVGFSLFERAWTLRGMDRILMDMIDEPEFLHDLLDGIVEVVMGHIEVAIDNDIDCVLFGDDWGSQNGLIMGPSLWREFIKPRVARLYSKVHDAGKVVAIHSCGDVKEILPDLVDSGLQLFNPFQPETMDVIETKRKYYGRLAFYGGISVQHLLPHGTPEEVRREASRLVKALGKGGGYIASPSHAVPADVPPENIAALIEVLQNQS